MNVLVIGGGGREHALVWKLAQSRLVKKLYAAPGNPGIAQLAEIIPGSDYLAIAKAINATLTVVGPEAPLVAGIVDQFHEADLSIVGPTQVAAQLEGSKIFAKDFMSEIGVPTARYQAFEHVESAKHGLARFEYPLVIKADGLAAGKGVVIARTREEATETIDAMFAGSLVGAAGRRVLLEDFCPGEEVSFIALSDGVNVVPLAATQDHKAVYDGDRGPNTGGMGAYRDSRIVDDKTRDMVMDTIMRPVVEGMRSRGAPFTGFLYAGLMMTAEGPKVLEFNVRLGDPETQPLMHGLDTDLAEVLVATVTGKLAGVKLTWKPAPSMCVVLCAQNYPAEPRKGDSIRGIEAAEATGATVFHAGTARNGSELVTNGGRVLGITGSGRDLRAAIESTYAAVEKIHFAGMHYRRDIGAKGLKRYNQVSAGT